MEEVKEVKANEEQLLGLFQLWLQLTLPSLGGSDLAKLSRVSNCVLCPRYVQLR